MQLQPAYAPFLVGSKVGAGIQGTDIPHEVAARFDRILILSPDRHLLYPGAPLADLGSRAIVRIMHWPDALKADWAGLLDYTKFCAGIIADCYRCGVRDFLTVNEPNLAAEGGGDTEADYVRLNQWGVNHINWLRGMLHSQGMTDVRLWGPALSPGHGEDDPIFTGGLTGYELLLHYLSVLDVLAVHFYGHDETGLTEAPDAEWFACRLDRVRAVIRRMGLTQPFAITEFNRPGTRIDQPASVRRYIEQVKRYYAWCNDQDDVIAACHFLATNTDPAFQDFTFSRMVGGLAAFDDFDRFAGLTGPDVPPVDPPPPPPPGPAHEWHAVFAAYGADHPDYRPANVAGTDEFGIVTQDFQAMTDGRYGVLRTNPGAAEVNGYEPQTIFEAWF